MNEKVEPELWDTYTEDRLPTGKTIPRGSILDSEGLHVVVHVCLFNRAGQMLIQRRTDDKVGWPGLWDFSTGGSVIHGESSREGAQREVFEELGCRIDLSRARPNFTFNFGGGFDDFYLLDHEVEIAELAIPNREVAEARWASREDVLALLGAEKFLPYRASVVEFIFDYRGHNDIFNRP